MVLTLLKRTCISSIFCSEKCWVFLKGTLESNFCKMILDLPSSRSRGSASFFSATACCRQSRSVRSNYASLEALFQRCEDPPFKCFFPCVDILFRPLDALKDFLTDRTCVRRALLMLAMFQRWWRQRVLPVSRRCLNCVVGSGSVETHRSCSRIKLFSKHQKTNTSQFFYGALVFLFQARTKSRFFTAGKQDRETARSLAFDTHCGVHMK